MDDDNVFDALPWPAIDPPDPSALVRMADDLVVLYHRQYEKKLYGWLRKSFGTKVDAEEITQETFLRLHSALCHGVQIEQPGTWVMTVGRNLAVNLARGHVREQAKVEEHAYLHLGACVPSPEDALVDQVREEQVEAALQALPAIERDCLLARCQDLTLREIGVQVGKDLRRVSEAIQRAVKRMRNLID
jgi:RNA polymerase sigma-70 factor, ECF subfamily